MFSTGHLIWCGISFLLIAVCVTACMYWRPTTKEFLTSVRAWQFFLYHAMIVIVAIYVGFSRESGLRFSDWKTAIVGLVALDVPSFYLNSVFSSEIYQSSKLVCVTRTSNFFLLVFESRGSGSDGEMAVDDMACNP